MAGEIIQYQTEDGATVIRLQASDGSVWLSQAEMAELFQTTKQSISLHVRNILEKGELEEVATVKENLTVQTEGKRKVSRPMMGLTSWTGEKQGRLPARQDAQTAKNYLEDGEMETLNRITVAFLEFAEAMAKNRKPMHMANWIAKLDDFLKLGNHPLLDGAGRVSAKLAQRHVDTEYDRWHNRAINASSAVEQHFIAATAKVKKLAADKPAKGKRGVQ